MDRYLRFLLYSWSTEIRFNGQSDIEILRHALQIREDWAAKYHIKKGYLNSMNGDLTALYYKIYYKNDPNWQGLSKLLEELRAVN